VLEQSGHGLRAGVIMPVKLPGIDTGCTPCPDLDDGRAQEKIRIEVRLKDNL